MISKLVTRTLLCFSFATVAVVFAGCQTMTMPGLDVEAAEMPAAGESKGQYQIQMVPAFGKSTVEKVKITKPTMVQDALESAGAMKKFRGMKISLNRVVADSGKLLSLPVEYDVKSKAVRPEQNYEVLPGDSISVTPKQTGALDKVMESLTGGL